MMLQVRKFTKEGNDYYENFVNDRINKINKIKSKDLIENENFTEIVTNAKKIDINKKFVNAFEFGIYLKEILQDCETSKIQWDRGVFNWLALAYFNSLFPGPRGGKKITRFFLSDQKTFWRKHLVRLRWEMCSQFGDLSSCLFSKEVNNWSDLEEQVTSSPLMISSDKILETIAKFYYRKINQFEGNVIFKRTDSTAIRELMQELYSLNLNFDLQRMTVNQILELKPIKSNFSHWLDK